MNERVLVPVLLDATGVRILFVGAGTGTETKLRSFLGLQPKIRIVAPEISDAVREWVANWEEVELFVRPFLETDLEGIGLVYGMTSDPEVNLRLARLCRDRHLWHNVAQQRGLFSFASPALASDEEVIVAFHSRTGKPKTAVSTRDDYLRLKETR